MAEVLKTFDFLPSRKTNKYPWSKWSDGRIWRIKKEADFKCTVAAMRANLRTEAVRKKKLVRTRADGYCVVFQFYDREPEDEESGDSEQETSR